MNPGFGDEIKMIPWLEQRRTQLQLREWGITDIHDELRCPKCGRIFKEKGVPLTVHVFWGMRNHKGSARCLIQEEYMLKWGRALTNSEFTRYEKLSKKCTIRKSGAAPKCACGCGEPVDVNERVNGWNKYVYGHYHHVLSDSELVQRLQKLLPQGRSINGVFQQRELSPKWNSRSVSSLCRKMETMGLIERTHVRIKNYSTFDLTLTSKARELQFGES